MNFLRARELRDMRNFFIDFRFCLHRLIVVWSRYSKKCQKNSYLNKAHLITFASESHTFVFEIIKKNWRIYLRTYQYALFNDLLLPANVINIGLWLSHQNVYILAVGIKQKKERRYGKMKINGTYGRLL